VAFIHQIPPASDFAILLGVPFHNEMFSLIEELRSRKVVPLNSVNFRDDGNAHIFHKNLWFFVVIMSYVF
jgi:hypothetical protein